MTAPWLLFSDEHLLTTTVLLQSFLIKIKGVAIGDGEGIVIVHLEAIEGYQLLVLVKVVYHVGTQAKDASCSCVQEDVPCVVISLFLVAANA